MLRPGQLVSGYRVEEHVADGSMGRVFRVTHVDRGTEHALKFLPLSNSEQRERLLREAGNLQRLGHPNVVTLTEVIHIGADPALIMEFIRGPSLEDWMMRERPLREIEQLFISMVKGVAHAHRHGIVHRDLKPSNVLLADTASGLVPKVADFGLSKLDESGPNAASLTHTDTSIGAVPYKPPEQVKDPRDVDSRADIYALGCLLYEMTTTRRAFVGNDPLELMNAVVQGIYIPAQELRPDLPNRFLQAIDGCLQVDPERRLGSCEALLSVLGEGAAMTPISAPIREIDHTARPAPKRVATSTSPALGMLAGAAIAVVVAGALLLFFSS